MYCEKCGRKASDGALFCRRCGAPIPVDEEEAANIEEPGKEADNVVPAQNHTEVYADEYADSPDKNMKRGDEVYDTELPEDQNMMHLEGYTEYSDYTDYLDNTNEESSADSRYSCRSDALDKKSNYPMKWYKFTIYFRLWMSMIGCIIAAITRASGGVWGNSEVVEYIYAEYPQLAGYDIIIAIISLVTIFVALGAQRALANYKRYAPYILYGMYALDIFSNILSVVSISSLPEDPSFRTGYEYVQITVDPTPVSIFIIVGVCFLLAEMIYYSNRKDLFVN
ncbi:MAG: zinc ribbon domain-containing protein [Ruminococcaceae bacterium]|nr:zinc ribbon domain-containing protein [Oscillospiraceae bacterium]